MKNFLTVFWLAIPAALGLYVSPVAGQGVESGSAATLPATYLEDRPSPDFHRSRRDSVLEALPSDAVAIVLSAPVRTRSADVDYPYHPSNDLYYLTGMTEPATALVLVPAGVDLDGRTVREVLLVPERDPGTERWTGRRLGADRAAGVLGVEAAVPLDRFAELLSPLLEDHRAYVLPWPEGVGETSELASQVEWLADRVSLPEVAEGRAGYVQRALMRARDDASYRRASAMLERIGGPEALAGTVAEPMARAFTQAGSAAAWSEWLDRSLAGYADQTLLADVLTRLREVKTEEELRFLRSAIDITADAQREAMRAIAPGSYEYQIEAVIEYVFQREGAEHEGFPSIVGSGENSTILHYESNRRRMGAGDVVVMDIGAEYRGYSADVTRTAPVSGRFTEPQRQIYESVLEAQDSAIAAGKVGGTFGEMNAAATEVLARRLQELGIISDPARVRTFFPHGVSHYLGLDVHDAGTYGPLRPGNVVTVEPGLYITPSSDVDERWWNIGIRIEDDVLVTERGPVVLSEGAPRSVEEVEALMREPGLAKASGDR